MSAPQAEPHRGFGAGPEERRWRPQRRGFRRPLLLAGTTVVTAILSGADPEYWPKVFSWAVAALIGFGGTDLPFPLVSPVQLLHDGVPFAFALMAFFLAHEMGHYLACRIYGVDSTLPHFIPAPTMIGTFGAVIRIRAPIPSRRALFDIGIAGPIAGFVVAIPVLVWGVLRSTVVASAPMQPGTIVFGESLLSRWIIAWTLPQAGNADLMIDPVFTAGWVGLLATSMNLIPAGQFDGGHIVYALIPRWHRRISIVSITAIWTLVAAYWLAYGEISAWVVWAVVMLLFGRRHPPLPYEEPSLGQGRRILALAALAILVLSFMPVPVWITGE